MSHALPANLDMEDALLGAMLLTSTAIDKALDVGITVRDFHRPSNGIVFDAILTAYDRGHVDELTVADILKARKQLEQVGGAAAIFTLTERCPAVANAKAYAIEVRDAAIHCRLVQAGWDISALAAEPRDDLDGMLTRAGTLLDAVPPSDREGEGFVTAESRLSSLFDEWWRRNEEGVNLVGIPTGFPSVDQILGGLKPDRLTILAARPAMGKTGFALNIARSAALGSGEYVAVFSLEMSSDDLTTRLVADLASIPNDRLQNTAPLNSDFDRISEAMATLAQNAAGRLLIDDGSAVTPMMIRSRLRRLQRKLGQRGDKLGLVIVDYIQLMRTGGKIESRQLEVAAISRELKLLSKELHVPVLALSQLSRDLERRNDKRPMLADLRDSGAIEQDADSVVFLYRPEVYFPNDHELQGVAEVIVAKNRNGKTGSAALTFIPKYVRFTDNTRSVA